MLTEITSENGSSNLEQRRERGPGLPGPGHNPAPEPETGAGATTPGPREKVNIGNLATARERDVTFWVIIFLAPSGAQ